MKVSASEQVQEWLISLAPETKRRVRLALRALTKGQGDIRSLRAPLAGYLRLRVGRLRIIYKQVSCKELVLIYANNRDIVYELFQYHLQKLQGKRD